MQGPGERGAFRASSPGGSLYAVKGTYLVTLEVYDAHQKNPARALQAVAAIVLKKLS